MQTNFQTFQPFIDKIAVGLSVVCAIHCFALPVALALMPSLLAMGLEDERFHTWLVFAIVPLAVIALPLGCSKHRDWSVLYVGIAGVAVLCLAAFLGHDVLGEVGEKLLTLVGSLLIAYSHLKNYRLCRRADHCDCSE